MTMNYEEQFKKLAKRDQDNIRKLAELQATATIGEAVLSLQAGGQAVDVPTLLVHLQGELLPLNPTHLRRMQLEAAVRLLGADPLAPAGS
jgi:hypothetical protein